ncbi:MAG: glutamate ligase domain-containing protein [Dehalococcoidia bacterium]
MDDSYNASPASMLAALELLSEMRGRRLALLGDMLELGAAEEEAHRQAGEAAARACDDLLLVGERAATMAEAAVAAGLRQVRVFGSKRDVVAALQGELRPGDYLLVKASRALALETVVEELRAR